MTSNPSIQECYVYITLPGQTEAVTAGRFVLTYSRFQEPIGRFVYGKRYLEREDAVAFDPVELKLTNTLYETTQLNGIFGALRDASPDYWGRRLIERYAQKTHLTELDYLFFSPDDRIGALGFGLNQNPPAPKRLFNQTIALEELDRTASLLLSEENAFENTTHPQIEKLLLLGTSMGGARPKTIVENEEGLWIAKFNRPDDKWNQARVEHAMLTLAKVCDLNVSESKIITAGKRDILLVKRFDREKKESDYLRFRMISALTLLRADESLTSREKWSYVLFSETLRRVSAEPKKDVHELFKRMCFNALISNLDDHPRNHAIIAKNKTWELSPAYDLTPSPVISMEHRELAMQVGSQGRLASAGNLLSQHKRFLLEEAEASAILESLESTIKNRWYAIARACGVTEKDCDKIATAFVYPGFRK